MNLGHIFFIAAQMWHSIDELHHFDLFEGPLHILLINRCPSAHFFKRECGVHIFPDEVNNPLPPPGEIGLFSHIRKWFFGSSNFLFDETQLITEGNEKLSISFSLMEGQD